MSKAGPSLHLSFIIPSNTMSTAISELLTSSSAPFPKNDNLTVAKPPQQKSFDTPRKDFDQFCSGIGRMFGWGRLVNTWVSAGQGARPIYDAPLLKGVCMNGVRGGGGGVVLRISLSII